MPVGRAGAEGEALAAGVTDFTTAGTLGMLVAVAEVPAVVNAFEPQPASSRLKQRARRRAIFIRIVAFLSTTGAFLSS